jgi:hypothetical protein
MMAALYGSERMRKERFGAELDAFYGRNDAHKHPGRWNEGQAGNDQPGPVPAGGNVDVFKNNRVGGNHRWVLKRKYIINACMEAIGTDS